MIRVITTGLMVLATLQVLQPGPLQEALQIAPQSPGSIEGIVVDGRTNQPMPNVAVSITPGLTSSDSAAYIEYMVGFNQAPGAGAAFTDSEGRFVLKNINPGATRLIVNKPGYTTYRADSRKAPVNSGYPVFVDAGQTLQGIVLLVFPAAIVTGRVRDLKGEPVSTATVYALRYGYNDLGELVPKSTATSSTDDRGEFRFNSLPPGGYSFRVEKNLVRFAQGNPASFYTTCYPGTRDLRSATTLQLEGGVETRLNDITLSSGRGGILTVRISRAPGAGNGTQVVIWRPGEPTDTTSGTFSDPNGGVVGQLPPGTYQVEVEAGQSRGYALVEVGTQDAEVHINVPNPATVVGRAGVGDPHNDNQFKPVGNISLQLLDTFANNSGNRAQLNSASSGRFINPSVKPGVFYVQSFNLPAGFYLAGVSMGDRDVLGEKFPIDGGNIDLNVLVGEGPGTVRGTVRDSRGKPVPGAMVALLPDDRSKKAWVVSGAANQNAVFELKGAPGSYHLYAWSELDGAAYRNAEFMSKFDSRGSAVRVEQDGKITVDLSILDEAP